MLDMVGWIVSGLFAGAIGKVMMPGKDPYAVYVAIILGSIGSLIGGFIGRLTLGYGRVATAGQLFKPGVLVSLMFAVFGAFVLLAGYRLLIRTNLQA
jgi:uncharacterized membrane protein YeaQ/YmgE (transglycosylase-associated protein family)